MKTAHEIKQRIELLKVDQQNTGMKTIAQRATSRVYGKMIQELRWVLDE